ncbi:MAG: hypothetical protein U1F76_05745 [Candidatus Competibacteraceae bacterium]
MNRSVKVLFSLLLLAAGMTASAATWIVDFTGKPEEFRLERGNQTIPIEIYRQLQPNDRLFVLVDDNTLFLKQDDGHRIEIRRDNSPYLIRDQGKPPAALDNFLHACRTWLTRQRLEEVDRPVIGIYTRAPGEPVPPINLPLASGAKAWLSVGTRPLYLAWQGGEPPYQVRLTNTAGKELVKQSDIAAPGGNTQPFKTAPVSLTPGRYRLIISDDAKRQATVTVEVVPVIPLPPPATLAGITDADIRQTLEALWLASQGEAWRLEAYQRVMPVEAQHRPARLLRYSLEKGQVPPPVKAD